ncbi:E3 ubiquitin-protein ligase RNF126-like [Neltuma alba]|uniref:E3 ubiquitin-protein ligase RNF126-like n=1 Tax=Neltuma alba TaxID=207710 RepID=UPI0010A46566|nr:E3 ubiquitin-protein ligase RNF126-like [Prosopis alba]
MSRPEDFKSYFCVKCNRSVFINPSTKRCTFCQSEDIGPCKIKRTPEETYIQQLRAFEASKKPASQSSIDEMEKMMITEELLEKQPECPICREEFQLETMVKAMGCGHFFHEHCIASWLGNKRNACPLCEASLPQATNFYPFGFGGGGGGSSSSSSKA